ncbi:MAG: hypothetical protein PHX80_04280 [Candidatus Nanoarchaeia archaeon]|nr:hypothetical protein [Candidatus Nanoarchaeia archaeon]
MDFGSSMGVQLRIGRVFTLFSFVCFLLSIVEVMINRAPILSWKPLLLLGFAGLFCLTTIKDNIILKWLQLASMLAASIIAFEHNSDAFALSIIFIGILLAREYDFFKLNEVIKYSCIFIILYFIFLIFPLRDEGDRFFLAFTYDLFIAIYYLVFWFIYKDQVIRTKEEDEKQLTEQLKTVRKERDDAQSLNDRFLTLAKEINESRGGRNG